MYLTCVYKITIYCYRITNGRRNSDNISINSFDSGSVELSSIKKVSEWVYKQFTFNNIYYCLSKLYRKYTNVWMKVCIEMSLFCTCVQNSYEIVKVTFKKSSVGFGWIIRYAYVQSNKFRALYAMYFLCYV